MNRKVWGVVGGAAALAVMLACGAESPSEQPFQPNPAGAATPSTTVSGKPMQTAKQVPTITEGTWEVGVDVVAGKYKLRDAVTSMCSWKITRAGTTNIVAIDIVTGGRPTVTIKKGQEFESDCGVWVKVG